MFAHFLYWVIFAFFTRRRNTQVQVFSHSINFNQIFSDIVDEKIMATRIHAVDYYESLNTDKEMCQEFKRLADKLDSELSTVIQQALAIGPLHTTLLEELTKVKIVLVGSSQDGSKVNTPYDSGDVDIILIATDKLLSEPMFRYVKDHPASLWVPAKNEEHAKYFIDTTLIEGQYVPVSVLRHIKKDFEEKLKADINRKVQHGIYISEDRINSIERSKVGYKYESMLTGDKDDTDEKYAVFEKFLSADIVPAFSFKGWPFTAGEWINRKRVWPSEEVVKKVVEKGCQIIAKRPLDKETDASIPEFIERHTDVNQKVNNVSDTQTEKKDLDETRYVSNAEKNRGNSDEENENDGYFRLSFSQCEYILVESLSKLQVLCWRVLKAYQKAYFETRPQVLKSYHWKTIVFWVVEETESIFEWNEENFMNGVLIMLDKMIACLQNRFLPLYFVQMQNLFTTTSECAINKTIDTIKQIRENPIESLRKFLENPPTPVTMKPELKLAKFPENLKPRAPQDLINETLNDARLFSGNTEEVIVLLKNDASLFRRYIQVVIDLSQDTLSQANNRGHIQIGQENPPVPNCATENRVAPTEKHSDHMEYDVNKTVKDALDQLKRSSKPVFSKCEQDIFDLLKEISAQSNNRGPIEIEHENPSAKKSATEIAESQTSSTEKYYKQTEFNVKKTFKDAEFKLKGALNSEEMCNEYQLNNVLSESEIPILESLLQLAGEGVKMLLGGERSAADPTFGRTFVRLIKQNQNPEASAPNGAQSHSELKDIMTNMEKIIVDFIEKKKQIKIDTYNNEIPDSEIPNVESILQSAWESLRMPGEGETRAADPEFTRTLVESMNQNPNGSMITDMEDLMTEWL